MMKGSQIPQNHMQHIMQICRTEVKNAMKHDARIRFTKQAVRKALLSLLEQKTIDDITVKELCDTAEINRATFYRYYDNQYDLLSCIENELLETIQESTQTHQSDIDALICEMFCQLYENRMEWLLLTSSNGDLSLSHKINKLFYHIFEDHITSEDKQMRYRFMVYGFSGVFDYWVKNGMKESVDEMADYLISYRHRLLNL